MFIGLWLLCPLFPLCPCISCVPCGTCDLCAPRAPCAPVSPVSLLVWNLCPLWPLCPQHPLCPLWPLSCLVLSCLAQGKRIPRPTSGCTNNHFNICAITDAIEIITKKGILTRQFNHLINDK